MHRRPALALVALLAAAVIGGLALSLRPRPPSEDPWRAQDAVLLARVERLAGSGDTAAAAPVLGELERRGGTQVDRARMALARGLLAGGDPPRALAEVRLVAWADKAPAIAAEVVGLELAIRWRGLLTDDLLRSGMLPPRDVRDSDQGRPGGDWALRREAFTAVEALLAGGARMVAREGGDVPLPATAAELALARYAHGAADWATTVRALGPEAEWTPATALAALRLHLEEHELDLAEAAAIPLWDHHPATPEAAAATRALGAWHLRRERFHDRRVLWPYPTLTRRLDQALAATPAAAEQARAEVDAESDLNRRTVERRSIPLLDGVPPTDTEEVVIELPEPLDEPEPRWELATRYDGLALTVPEVVGGGESVRLAVASDLRGPHRVALWRIADDDAWERLTRAPAREDLPAEPAWTGVIDLPGRADGGRATGSIDAPAPGEGRWIATATARGCPVVVLASLRVATHALHALVGRDGALLWAVGRGDGRGAAGVPLGARVTLVRPVAGAAGGEWATRAPAWRSGFAEGFTGERDTAWRGSGQDADFAAGRAAGEAAAARDPAFTTELTGTTGADGTWRPELPGRLVGRAWTLEARIDRAGAHERCTAAWGAEAHWTAKAVCWADKPLVRPGETLRFAGVLREHDGEAFRLPAGALPARLAIEDETVWSGDLTIDARGMIAGAALVPPGAREGAVTLVLDGKGRHPLARCERVRLPPVRLEVLAEAAPAIRAGEPRLLRVRLHDAAGEPIAGATVVCTVQALVNGREIPGERPPAARTDLAGEAAFSIATAEGREADYRAEVAVEHGGRTYWRAETWRTTAFPFPLTVDLPERALHVGQALRVRLALPPQAEVRVALCKGDVEASDATIARGDADGRAELLLPLTDSTLGADALRVWCPTLGGGSAERLVPLTIGERVREDTDTAVRCVPDRTRVRPGENLAIALGCTSPGRDLLLVAGTAAILAAGAERLDEPVRTVERAVPADWGPSCTLRALAWLPGRGFVASAAREIEVLPVDRLLAVEVRTATEWRPGDTVEAVVSVRDAGGAPVAGAGITLGVVDERLYRLAEDATPDLWRYFHQYRRPWTLVEAERLDDARVAGQLWRAVARRWTPGMAVGEGGGASGMYGQRSGGGRKRCLAYGGGAAGLRHELRALGGEADPTVHWVAGVVTGADGTATVRVALPADAASYRITARAADASPGVLVGEVRTVAAARHPHGLRLQAPTLVRTGDRVAVVAEVANHRAHERRLRLRLAGEERTVVVPGHGRRSVAVAITVPAPAPDAPVARADALLGRRAELQATLEEGGTTIAAAAAWLVAEPGLPRAWQGRLVADADGIALDDRDIPVGAPVELTVRAWPDAAARRADELAGWRTRHGVRGAVAWLFADDGAERRRQLAAAWSGLPQDPAGIAVRLTAVRLGAASGGIEQVPDGVLGDWLLARGRALGLALPAPRLRGAAATGLDDRCAAAATALAEGWSEGAARWRAARDEVLAVLARQRVPARTLALALDAAQRADDAPAIARLTAALAVEDWSDDLAAVLAAELLPAQAAPRPAPVTVQGASTPTVVEAAAGARWSGILAGPLRLQAAPGALIECELRWHAPMATAGDGGRAPTLALWQLAGDGWRPLPTGAALWPGRPLLLVADARDCPRGWSATVPLPALLRLGKAVPAAQLIERERVDHPLLPEDRARLLELVSRWSTAEGDGVATARADALAAFADALARAPGITTVDGQRVDAGGGDGHDPAGGMVSLAVAAGAVAALALTVEVEGEALWPEVALAADNGAVTVLPEHRLRVAPDGEAAADAAVEAGHPARADLAARAAGWEAEELAWLLERDPGSAESWRSLGDTLDPAARHTLDDLLAHPLAARRGHWTQTALRRWLDAEPALDDLRRSDEDLFGSSCTTLADVADLVDASRSERTRAWLALPAPQTPPTRPLATIRAWSERLMTLGTLERRPFAEWIWEQDLDAGLLERFGYARTLDGWAAFCRRELGLDVRLRGDVPVAVSEPRTIATSLGDQRTIAGGPRTIAGLGGAALGTAGLAGEGLVVVRRGEICELQPIVERGEAVPMVALAWEDLPASSALNAINEQLANRGLPPLRFADGVDASALPPISLRFAGRWTDAAAWMGRLWNLERVGREFRPLP